MEDDLKMCMNKRCKANRFQVLVFAPNRRYCECGAKLKNSYGHSPDDPFFVDTEADIPDRQRRSKMSGDLTKKTNLVVMSLNNCPRCRSSRKDTCYWDGNGPCDHAWHDTDALEALTWNEFLGSTEAYQTYLADFRAGKITDNMPYIMDWVKQRNSKSIGKGGSRSRALPAASDDFHCPTSELEGCPLFKEKKSCLIHMPYQMLCNWIWLALRFDTEWLAYLKGTCDSQTGIWTLTEMYFPKQKANGAHLDAADGEILPDTIGTIHSHVGMSAFFSAEDKKHFNHDVEMVVNRKGELAASVRRRLECSRFTRLESSVLLLGSNDPLYNGLENTLRAKLTPETTSVGGMA